MYILPNIIIKIIESKKKKSQASMLITFPVTLECRCSNPCGCRVFVLVDKTKIQIHNLMEM